MAAPLTPLRRAVLAAGGLLSLLVITVTVLSIVDRLGRTSYQRDYVLAPVGTVHRLVVRNTGAVFLTPSGDSDVHLRVEVTYGLAQPHIVRKSTSDGVTLAADCHGWMAESSCSVTFVVQVPEEFSVEATSSIGDLSANDLTGRVQLTTSAGDIRVSRMTGDLVLHTRAGDVVASDLGNRTAETSRPGGLTVEARTTAGDVTLAFAAAPSQVTAHTAAGDVVVALPPADGGYQISATSRVGDEHIEGLQDTPGSGRRIDVTSSAGDVTVRHTAE